MKRETRKDDGMRKPYERPSVHSYSEEDLLDIVGPAQAYSGHLGGTPGGGSL
jgi:hypothetical protein